MKYTEFRITSFTIDEVRNRLAEEIFPKYPDIANALWENRPLMVGPQAIGQFRELVKELSLPLYQYKKRFHWEVPEAVRIVHFSNPVAYAVYRDTKEVQSRATLCAWLVSQGYPRLADIVRCRGDIIIPLEIEDDFIRLSLPYKKKGEYSKRGLPVRNFLFEKLE